MARSAQAAQDVPEDLRPARRGAPQDHANDVSSAFHHMFGMQARSGGDGSWSPARKLTAGILDSAYTEVGMTLLVGFNLVLAIVQVDTEARGQDVSDFVSVSTSLLVGVYCIEVSARLFVERCSFFFIPINQFDFVIVVADVMGGFVELFVGGGASIDLAAFRIIRAFRLLRSARIMIMFRSLYLLCNGMAGALKAVVWAFIMLSLFLILCSIFAVATIQPYVLEMADTSGVFDGCSRCTIAYSSVWHAYMTFFQQIVAGDSWGTVTMQVMDEHPWTALFFIPSFLVIQLGLINMILAVIVDSAEEAREANRAFKLEVKGRELVEAQKNLEDMCAEMDSDGSGELTLDELMEGFEHNTRFFETLQLMDIDREDMKIVFNILDADKSGHCTYAEFVDSLWKMKSQSSHTLLVFIKSYVTDVKRSIEESMRVLTQDVGVKLAELHALHARYAEDDCAFDGSGGPDKLDDDFSRSPRPSVKRHSKRTSGKHGGTGTHGGTHGALGVGIATLLMARSKKIEQKLDQLFKGISEAGDVGVVRPSVQSAVSNGYRPLHQQQQCGKGAGCVAVKNAKVPKAPNRIPEITPPPDIFFEGDCLEWPDVCSEGGVVKRPESCSKGATF